MARQQFRRYIWLIDTIISADGITYEEISRKWERSSLNEDGDSLPKRTFFDHLNAIRDEFDIDIQCDRRDNTYRIGEEYDEYGSVKKTFIDSLILNNALREKPELNNRVIFTETWFYDDNLPILLKAIKECRTIRFTRFFEYSSLREKKIAEGLPEELVNATIVDYSYSMDFETYGLCYCTRWFLVGRSVKDGRIYIHAISDLKDIRFLDSYYVMPADFDTKSYMMGYKFEDYLEDLGNREVDSSNEFEIERDSRVIVLER
jgi:hypothetical protein